MPELPDLVLYLERLEPRVLGRELEALRIASPFLLRTVDPPPQDLVGRRVSGLSRLGKRLVLAFEGGLFAALHLMVAGRLRWRGRGAAGPGGAGLGALDFEAGTLLLTEAGSKRRASLHVLRGEEELARLDPGGLEVLEAEPADFERALARESHTLKRALCDPRILSGIGNAFSDEILHRARLSPVRLTGSLEAGEVAALFEAARGALREWTDRLRDELGPEAFPEKVTAFREGMAVHGRFGQPCPVCGTAVQRIRRASNETNYCPRCQTGGRLLRDRSLSRLLKDDWPRTAEEWESRRGGGTSPS